MRKIMLTLPPELADKLSQIARLKGTNRANLIRMVMTEYAISFTKFSEPHNEDEYPAGVYSPSRNEAC